MTGRRAVIAAVLLGLLAWLLDLPGPGGDQGAVPQLPDAVDEPGERREREADRTVVEPDSRSAGRPATPTDPAAAASPPPRPAVELAAAGGEPGAAGIDGGEALDGAPEGLTEQAAAQGRHAAIVEDRLQGCVARLDGLAGIRHLDAAWRRADELARLELNAAERARLSEARRRALQRSAAELRVARDAAVGGRVLEHEATWRALAGLESNTLCAALEEPLEALEIGTLGFGARLDPAAVPADWDRRGLRRGRLLRVRLADGSLSEARLLRPFGDRVAVRVIGADGAARAPMVARTAVEPVVSDAAFAVGSCAAALRGRDVALAWAWLVAAAAAGAPADELATLRAAFGRAPSAAQSTGVEDAPRVGSRPNR